MASRSINSLLTKANRSPNGTILCGEGSGLIESWTHANTEMNTTTHDSLNKTNTPARDRPHCACSYTEIGSEIHIRKSKWGTNRV
jgi:hypothetical protein